MATLRIEHPGGCDRWPSAEWWSGDAHVFLAWPTPSDSAMATCRSWEMSLPLEYRCWKDRFVDDHSCFYVWCAVDVLRENSDKPVDLFSVVPPSTISSDLGRLLIYNQDQDEKEELETASELSWRRYMLPDVTFNVEQAEIKAHGLVLAMRSPDLWTKALFSTSEFRWQTTESTLHVHDMSASIFRAMLHFIYTDELPPMKPSNKAMIMLDLLVAADRYAIESLRLMCEKILSESLDVSSVMPTLMVVHGRESCKSLEAVCIRYMGSDPDVYAAVKETEDYQELKESCCYFILEVTDKVAKINMGNTPGPDAPSSSSSHQPLMNTATHYSSEVVEGTHEFKIPHFNAVQGRYGVGKEISSGTFQVGGYDWKVKLYPSSSSEKAEGHISLYVELLTDPGTSGVKATVCFKMDCPGGWPPYEKLLEKTFNTKSDWGYAKFITMESAKSRHLEHDGSLTIHCDLSVTKKVCTSTSTTTDGARARMTPSNDIISHLDQLLVGEQGSDMRFLVKESEQQAHGLFIAMRSKILYEEVAVATKDNHIILVNDTTVAVFKAMLHFIYTDELPPMEDLDPGVDEDEVTIAQDLLVAASWFSLDRMKAMCENLLVTLISEENALRTSELARDLHCSELEDYCNDFIELAKLVREGNIDIQLLNMEIY
ncbi:hypothetical protein ACQ4PT_036723 [Festuca glaucescens]